MNMDERNTDESNGLFIPLLNLKGCRGSTTSSDGTPVNHQVREISLDSYTSGNVLPFQDFASSRDPSLDQLRRSASTDNVEYKQRYGTHSIRPVLRPSRKYLPSYTGNGGLSKVLEAGIRSSRLVPPHHFSSRYQLPCSPPIQTNASKPASVGTSSIVSDQCMDIAHPLKTGNRSSRISRLHIPPHFFSRIALTNARNSKNASSIGGSTSPMNCECDIKGFSLFTQFNRCSTPLSVYSDLNSSYPCSSRAPDTDEENISCLATTSKQKSIEQNLAELDLCTELIQKLLYEWKNVEK